MLLLPTRNLVRESRQPRRARVWRSVGARTKAAALRLLEAREEDTPPSAPLDSPSGIVAKNGRSSGDARRLGERCKQTWYESHANPGVHVFGEVSALARKLRLCVCWRPAKRTRHRARPSILLRESSRKTGGVAETPDGLGKGANKLASNHEE